MSKTGTGAPRADARNLIRVIDHDAAHAYIHATRYPSSIVLAPGYFNAIAQGARIGDVIECRAGIGRSEMEFFDVAITAASPGRGVTVAVIGKIERVKASDGSWRVVLDLRGEVTSAGVATAKQEALKFAGDDPAEIKRIEAAAEQALGEVGIAA